jgi:2-methylisocitrate lyase-like PEP mutase family enzyme
VADSVRWPWPPAWPGLSIEDSTGDAAPLFALDDAVARLRAARAAIDAAGGDVLLVGRAECFLVGQPDIDATITRLQAYAAAGADVLYAPGIQQPGHIRAVVAAVAPKPVNLLVGSPSPMTVADIAALGVRRISVGGALARSAWAGFQRAAQSLADGRFDGFTGAASGFEPEVQFPAFTSMFQPFDNFPTVISNVKNGYEKWMLALGVMIGVVVAVYIVI